MPARYAHAAHVPEKLWRGISEWMIGPSFVSRLPLAQNRLAIYLNDHLAGATGAVELARRAAQSNHSSSYGPPLAELADEIARDRELLVETMQALGVPRDTVKSTALWLAEKAGRLKLNGSVVHYSPLSRLEELELLSLGVQGKRALWDALRRTYATDERLRGIDLDAAIERALSQRRRLEALRRRAAHDALAPASGR